MNVMNRTVTLISPEGSSPFPLGRIFGLTRTYPAHAEEMGASPKADPAIFTKPFTAFLPLSPERVPVITRPSFGNDLHHEVEIVILVLNPDEGRFAFSVGADLTLRDVQARLKSKGLPWSIAKGFDHSAPTGRFFSDELVTPGDLGVELRVNDEKRQEGRADQMLLPLMEIPSYVGTYFPLLPGDIIFTGTPSGVGPILPGETVTITLREKERQVESVRFMIGT